MLLVFSAPAEPDLLRDRVTAAAAGAGAALLHQEERTLTEHQVQLTGFNFSNVVC